MVVKALTKVRDEPDPKAEPPTKSADTLARSWAIPITTVLLLVGAFCLYYFVYVGAKREYLVNRNFRSLAALGDQLQRILSTHASILEFYSQLAEPKKQGKLDRKAEGLDKFLLVRPEDKDLEPIARERESRRDFIHFLAPTFDLLEEPIGRGRPRPRLQVERRDGRWQILLSAMRHAGSEEDFLGTLEIGDLLKGLWRTGDAIQAIQCVSQQPDGGEGGLEA
jgi:hypothetical protein